MYVNLIHQIIKLPPNIDTVLYAVAVAIAFYDSHHLIFLRSILQRLLISI